MSSQPPNGLVRGLLLQMLLLPPGRFTVAVLPLAQHGRQVTRYHYSALCDPNGWFMALFGHDYKPVPAIFRMDPIPVMRVLLPLKKGLAKEKIKERDIKK